MGAKQKKNSKWRFGKKSGKLGSYHGGIGRAKKTEMRKQKAREKGVKGMIDRWGQKFGGESERSNVMG